jgi:transposase
MPWQAISIVLSDDDRLVLESRARAGSAEYRYVLRAKIVLGAANGRTTGSIAKELGVAAETVSRWRRRFAECGVSGLADRARSGKPVKHGDAMERRILAKLDGPPPSGYAGWNGRLLAESLGDVTASYVWRVLRKRGICLERRHSWCISTDPEFACKAADIVGLYLSPPENAVVLCVDEKPSIQALERAQGWLKLPDGRAITGFSHEYKRHGTTTLFAALEVATGQVKGGHYNRKRRREFLDFMNELVAGYPKEVELHVVLDNLSTHKPKNDQWLARHPNVRFHFTPTHASWLNQIEVWFSILWRHALKGASFTSPRQVRQAIDRFIQAYSQTAAPFEWTKAVVHSVHPKRYYADLGK